MPFKVKHKETKWQYKTKAKKLSIHLLTLHVKAYRKYVSSEQANPATPMISRPSEENDVRQPHKKESIQYRY